ncbi:MAG: alpha-L-arabinofuranosidase C-terminal domain-containing protein [Promethearchaeota archaeon]
MYHLRKIPKKYGRMLTSVLFRLLVEPLGLFKVYWGTPKEEPTEPLPAPAAINIDTNVIEGEIDRLIYGSFIEVMGKCIYGGIWDEYNKNVALIHGGLREDVINEIRALNLAIIRYPGGVFADTYHWKNGIGPNERRKARRNKFWHWLGPKVGPKYNNHFGSDEFMLFMNEIGVEPYININYGTGTPEEAAQWVEYMNGDASTEYGALRAENGHFTPYNVKYWGIGNEIYGPWEPGYSKPEDYAQHYLEFAEAMKAVDPYIKLIAVGADFEYSYWNRPVLEIAGDQISYLSYHIYMPGKFLDSLSNSVQDFYNIISSAFEIEKRIEWVENSIVEVISNKEKIPIALDEWNIWWNVRQLYEGYYTLRDGLLAASIFEIFHRHANTVKMALFSSLVNVLPAIVTNPTDVYHNPIYLAIQLFATHAEQFLVSSSVNCETRHNPRYGKVSEVDLPYLGCSVTINKMKNRLVIIGINRHHIHEIPTKISISHFDPEPITKIFELNGPSHSAYNFFDKKNDVKIQEKEFSSDSSKFTYTFPAHSVTALVLHKNK